MMPESLTSVANHLWQSTLFAAAAGLLTLAFRRNRAPVRYGLWMAASLKFLIPFSLLIAAASRLAPPAAPAIAHSPLLPVIDQISEPFLRTSAAPSTPAESPLSNRLPAVLLGIWLCGVVANLFGWWKQWRLVRAAVGDASPLCLGTPIPVMSTRAGLEPGVFGIRRPVLLLPEGIALRLTAEQLNSILVHELCHVRRRDNLAAAIHMLVEAIFWFHPLVWWIESRLVEERERACDEEVLLQSGDPRAYAEGILNVCRLYVESPLACVSGVTGSGLKKRIEAIMTHRAARNLNGARKALLATAALAAIAVPMIVGIVSPSHARAQSETAKRVAFEVVSIKPIPSTGPARIGWEVHPGGRFHAANLPLMMLIAAAYDVPFQSQRLTGGTEAVLSERYDIDAIPEKGAIPAGLTGKALDAKIRPMLRTLLAERFKLVIRRESKELPVYAIIEAKGGAKLKPSAIQEKDCSGEPGSGPDCHGMHGGMGRGLHGTAVDLDDVALFVANWTDRPVINRTSLPGLFEIDTEGWTPMQPRQPNPDGSGAAEAEAFADPTRPSVFMIFTQLGLKLDPRKAPIDLYVIESVERPTAN